MEGRRRVLGSKHGFEALLWKKISVEKDKIPIVESRISGEAHGLHTGRQEAWGEGHSPQ